MKTRIKLVTVICLFVSTNLLAQLNPNSNFLGTLIDPVSYESYSLSFSYADSICARSVMVSMPWSDLEPSPGVYNFSNLQTKLNLIKSRGNLRFELNVQPLHMNGKTVPSDLTNMLFDNPIMIQRYKAILDSVFKRVDTLRIIAFNIGNEYDGWLFDTSNVAARVSQWMTFLKQARPYAKQKYAIKHPNETLKIGTTSTFDGLCNPSTPWIRNAIKYINDSAYMDVISVNYYAIDTGFMNFKNPVKVVPDFDTMVNFYANQTKPFHITECGYPSGDSCGSSTSRQSQFITNVFSAWNNHSSRIEYISFFKLQDWSWWVANYFTQSFATSFGWTNSQKVRFREYLRTLGLRDGNGNPKPAYYTLKNEISTRLMCLNNSTSTGEIDSEGKPFSIFPNPANQTLHINVVDKNSTKLIITDITGSTVKSFHNLTEEINISDLSPGLYFLRIDGRLNTIKLIKN